MDEKRFARLKQLCSETGNGDYSTDAEWGELALDLTHDMVAEIERLREALEKIADESTPGDYRVIAITALKGGGDE